LGVTRAAVTDDLKTRTERWAGEQFMSWYNVSRGTRFRFYGHGTPPQPDLLYSDGSQQLWLEITGSFYGQDGADFEGMNARGLPNAPESWSSLKPDGTVVSIDAAFCGFLEKRLREKARKTYASVPILVVYHVSRLLSSESLSSLIHRLSVPEQHPFSRIFLVAGLPTGDPEGAFCVRELGQRRSRVNRQVRNPRS
jgi:hypothetical protein